MGSKLVTNLPAPQVWQRSGSHSLTAKKHGHCLVLHCALQRQPGKRFWPSAGDGQSVIVPVNEKEKHERQVTKRKWNMCLKKIFLRFSWILQLVENFLHCTQCGKKTEFIDNGILLLIYHLILMSALKETYCNVLGELRFSARKYSTYNQCCIDRTSHRSFVSLHRYMTDHTAVQDGHTECNCKHE